MGLPARWTPEDRERGLTALVLAGSSTIAEPVCGIPASTLRKWKQEHPDHYDRLATDLEPKVVDKIAADAENIALLISDRERVLIESLTDQEILRLEPKDKAATLRNLSTSKALQIDKLSSPLRERPSHVQPDAGLEHALSRIARRLGFDTTAEPITDATVIEPHTPAPTLRT